MSGKPRVIWQRTVQTRMQRRSETWKLDFGPELERIDAALQRAGIDTTQPLHAPVKRSDDEEA
ncbi:hypothetical protein WQE_34371 [Paraburkholderia hospita]|uniref:Uncharacterized protein n=1 Tax=Paraburkholderia hospita TaxID=169430 RepID=A0ABN0FD80_9BURK|nr:hypothetical protein WQE_34371 [Paraburkholderia hospita]OUL88948.1 hypothetical protein CA601_17665 [Paraburkholderia hospita]OUL93454.1 hypothetical protein CA602_01350 [Paraburkholderia hospita]